MSEELKGMKNKVRWRREWAVRMGCSQQPLSNLSEPPSLEASTTSAVTNEYGVARLVLQLRTGSHGATRSLSFGTNVNDVKSPRSRSFTIEHPVASVSCTDFQVNRLGNEGVGDPVSTQLAPSQPQPNPGPATRKRFGVQRRGRRTRRAALIPLVWVSPAHVPCLCLRLCRRTHLR